MNETAAPRLLANPNRTQVRTEADLHLSTASVKPEGEPVAEKR